jgi:hypothetical protein
MAEIVRMEKGRQRLAMSEMDLRAWFPLGLPPPLRRNDQHHPPSNVIDFRRAVKLLRRPILECR